MKKQFISYLLILFSIFFQNLVLGQSKLKFVPLSNEKFENLGKQFKEYKIYSLDRSTLATLNSGENVSIQLEENYDFVLKENQLFSPNYVVNIKDDNGIQKKTLQELNFEGRFYSNADKERNHILRLSSYNESYSIYVQANGADFFMEPLKKYSKKAKDNEYIYYEGKNVVFPKGVSIDDVKESHTAQNRTEIPQSNSSIPDCKTVEVAIAVDYSTFDVQGGNINLAIYYSANLMNTAEANYSINSGLSDDIHFKIIEQRINTTPTCNVWPSTVVDVGDLQYAFSNAIYYGQMFTSDYDIPIYLSQYVSGPYIGMSTLNTLCSEYGSGALVSASLLSLMLDSLVLSHEIGHYFGCGHVTGSANIMAPGISVANISWASSSITTLDNKISTGTCFSTCETDVCETQQATNLSYSVNSSTHEITVSWTLATNISYKVRLYSVSTDTWTSFTTVGYPNHSIVFNYTQVHCTDKYRFEIIPICPDITAPPPTYITLGAIKQIAFDIQGQAPEPSIHISYDEVPGGGNMCEEMPALFIATGNDWGTSPTFQWYVNGLPVGTNQNTLSYMVSNGDIVTCVVTSSDSCVIDDEATSNEITVSLSEPTTPTITIDESICESLLNGYIYATYTHGGNSPTFEWYVNGIHDTNIDPGSSFYDGELNNGDEVYVIMYSSEYCTTSETAVSETVIIDCDLRLDLRLFLEGYYIGSSQMRPVLLNQGVSGATSNITDDIIVEIYDPSGPTFVSMSSAQVTTGGYAVAFFPGVASNQSYYIAVKHRNSIETWSANPVNLALTYNNYDFTTDDSQAYGDNMVNVGSGKWAFFTGDINQDDNIDTIDYPLWETDSNNFESGWFATDLNGDGNVDSLDYPIWENNSNNYVTSLHP